MDGSYFIVRDSQVMNNTCTIWRRRNSFIWILELLTGSSPFFSASKSSSVKYARIMNFGGFVCLLCTKMSDCFNRLTWIKSTNICAICVFDKWNVELNCWSLIKWKTNTFFYTSSHLLSYELCMPFMRAFHKITTYKRSTNKYRRLTQISKFISPVQIMTSIG